MNNEFLNFKLSKPNNSFQINKNNQERTNSKSMTISNNSKMDMWYFKNDILKDLKSFQKDITNKYNKGDLIIKEELHNINKNINSINIKINELSTLITVDNMTKEKVENLDKIKNKILDNILSNEIKVNNIDKETKESLIEMNNILKETVIYNGLIGPSCKFRTFHDLIDYILSELLLLENYKDKNAMDLSTYKKKLDSLMQGLKFQIEGINKTSAQFTLDNFNILDKKLKDFTNNINEKLYNIKVNLEENLNNINNKFDELENKLNELRTDNDIHVNSFNEHIQNYLMLKKEIKKIDIINNSNNIALKKRNSIFNRLDSKIEFDENMKTINNNINKNKIKRVNTSIKKENIEKLKNKLYHNDEFQIRNNFFKENDIIINEQEKTSSKKNININDNELIKMENYSNDKINSKNNLEINKENFYLLGKSLNNENNTLNSLENKKSSKNYIIFSENNTNSNVALSDSEKERVKNKIKSPDINLNKGKKIISKFFMNNEKRLDITSSQNSSNSQISQNYLKNYEDEKKSNNNILTEREIKSPFNKTKYNKNLFNKKLKKLDEQNNNLYFSDFNKYKTINSSINTMNDKIFNIKNNIYSSRFKNIILTLEGTKKMVIDAKDKDNGKNIYHVESIKSNKKYPKLKINNERLLSSNPNINNKNNNLYKNDDLYTPIDEFSNNIKFKNAKIIYLVKSKSHKTIKKNKTNSELEPSFSFTGYSSLKNKFLNIEEINCVKDRYNKNKELKEIDNNKRNINRKK